MNDSMLLQWRVVYPFHTLHQSLVASRATRFGLILCLLLGGLLPGKAQIYYILQDNLATTRTDALIKVNYDGTGLTQVTTNFADAPGAMAIDSRANKAFIAEARVTVNPKVISVDLTTFASTTLASIANFSGCTGIAIDPVRQYIYYAVGDGIATTTTDQIRRVNCDGTGDQLIVDNYVNSPGALSIDLTNNRLFAVDVRSTAPKIVSINLSTSAITTVLPTAAISASNVVVGIAYDSRIDKLYYILSDQNSATSTDPLRRINPDGTSDELVLSNFNANAPGNLAFDRRNNLLFVVDQRATAPEIFKIDLGGAPVSATLVTSNPSSNTASLFVRGIATYATCATFVTTLTPSPSSTLTCSQTSLTLTATGGSSYVFARTGGGGIVSQSTSGSAVINASGTYSVTVTDADGCTMTNNTTITQNTTPPSATITIPANLTVLDCNTTVLSLSASGGGTYRWDNGQTTAIRNVNTANTYSVTVTGANGCTAIDTQTITQNITTPIVNLTATNVCAGQSLTLTATSGIGNYTFVDGTGVIGAGAANTTTVSGLSAGPYSFTVLVRSLVNSCTNTATASATVAALPTPTLTPSPTSTLTCAQTSLTLTATGGTSYTFAGTGLVSSNSTAGTAVVSGAGTYTVTVGNGSGCTSSTTTTVTGSTVAPTLSLTLNNACVGQGASVSATTGFSSYTFISPFSGSLVTTSPVVALIPPVTSGSAYTVTAQNSLGCRVTSTVSFTIYALPTPNLSAAPSSTLTCVQTSLTLTATGGVSYTFAGPGITSQNAAAGTAVVNGAGTYTVTVANANGCTATSTTVVSQSVGAPTAGLVSSGTLTCSVTAVTLTASGGVSYTFAGPGMVSSNAAAGTAVVNAGGLYSVTVADASGCTGSTTTTVSNNISPPSILLPSVSTATTGITIPGGLIFTASGGDGTYTFAFSTLPSGLSVTNSSATQRTVGGTPTQAGVFPISVTVTDGNGCATVNTSYTLTVNCPSQTLTTSSFSTVVVGQSINGNPLFWSVAGGTEPYSFSFSTLPPGLSINGSSSAFRSVAGTPTQVGTFPISLTITDFNNCPVVVPPFTLTVNCPNITLTTPGVSTALVGVNINSVLNWSASGGSSPYTFTFGPLPTGLSVVTVGSAFRSLGGTITQEGTYPISLTVTDVNGCSVVAPPFNLTLSCRTLALTTPSYSTALVGRSLPAPLAWEVAGGTSPYSFSFSSFSPGLVIGTTFAHYQELIGTPTQVGTFPISLTVTDANGCSLVSSTYSLTTSCATLALSTTTNIASCSGTGSIAFTTTLPNGIYSLSYVGAGSPRSVLVNSGGFSLTGLSAGSYGSFSINYGSSACILTVGSTVVLTNPASPTVGITPASGTLTCSQTSLTLTASTSGTGVVWSTGATTNSIVVTTANTYTVTATDANGCTSSTTTTVSSNTTAPTLTVTPGSGTLTCAVTSLTLTASGTGTSYVWTGSTTGATLPVSTSGTYSVTATAANGCTSTTSVVVSQSVTLPTPGLVVSGTLTCAVTNLTLTASGGNSYAFSGPGVVSQNAAAGTAVVNASGTYSVTVTNTATSCSSVTTTTVSSNTTAPTPGLVHSGTVTCANPRVTLTASGGSTYAFAGAGLVASSGGSATVNQGGTFTVIVTGSNGCTALTTTTISSNTTAPTASLVASGTITCSVPTVVITASGGGTYAFAGPGLVASLGSSATVNVGGLYSVTVTNIINGCFSTTTVTVPSNLTSLAPTVSIANTGTTVCEAASVLVVATVGGPVTGYQWYKNPATAEQAVAGQTSATLSLGNVTQAQAGSYVLIITSGCGSFTSNVFTLTVNPLPTVTLLVPNNATVQGGTITLPAPLTGINFQVLGGVSFERLIIVDRINGFEIRQVDNNASGIFPINRTGPFRLTVTDANGCQRTVDGVVQTQ